MNIPHKAVVYKFITRTTRGLWWPANSGGPCLFLYICWCGGIDKLVLLFLWLFLLSRSAFGDEFSMAEVFYGEHWSNLYHKLQNKSKIEIKEPISVRRRVCSCCSLCVGSPFQFSFLPWKPCFFFYTKVVSQCYMKVSFIPFFRSSLWLAVVRPWQRHQWLGWKW